MSARRGRLLQAYSDGEHLVIQMTELLSCEDKNSPFINHAFRYLMSEPIGDTSGLSDVIGTKAAQGSQQAKTRQAQARLSCAEGVKLAANAKI
jgi:hypothetical protein